MSKNILTSRDVAHSLLERLVTTSLNANGHLTTPPRQIGIDCTPQSAAAKCCFALIKFEFVEIFHLFARRLLILPEECITANKEVQFSTEKAAQRILR